MKQKQRVDQIRVNPYTGREQFLYDKARLSLEETAADLFDMAESETEKAAILSACLKFGAQFDNKETRAIINWAARHTNAAQAREMGIKP